MAQASLVKRYFNRQRRVVNQEPGPFWQNKNVRWFLIGDTTWAVGQVFYTLALPWYVLRMTGSTAAIGMAILSGGLGRIAFMLAGGTLTDRYSPRALAASAYLARALLLAALAWTALAGRADLPVILGMSFAVGLTEAILLPARGAILPQLVPEKGLKAANSLAAAQGQFWGLVGPGSASLILTQVRDAGGGPTGIPGEGLAIGAAFAIHALLLVLTTLVTLSITPSTRVSRPSEAPLEPAGRGSVRELLVLIWKQDDLRTAFAMVGLVNLVTSGPLWVGLPMLAASRFPGGPEALGFLTSALGCGSLLGTGLAGLLPQRKPLQSRPIRWLILGGLLAGLALLACATRTGAAAAGVLVVSFLASCTSITGVTQIQRSTPAAYLGRMMGLLNLK